MLRKFLFPFFFLVPAIIFGQEHDYETFIYFENDTVKLELDLFRPDSGSVPSPLVIHVHGGGFSGGNRSHGHPFCRFLSENGIPAASISYSLSMKGKSFSCDGVLAEKIKAIQMAAHQTRIATLWFINNAPGPGIDTNSIILAGRSAGAEAVLQAAFMNPLEQSHFPDTLSASFRYAGIISGAGALLDINLITRDNKIPVLSYHGTCDPLVPYHVAPHHYCAQTASGYMMFFGSLAIHERLTSLNGSSQLMTYCNEGHKHAGTPFSEAETHTVLDFIDRAMSGEKFSIHRIFKGNDICKMGLEFDFCY
ncbi:MAG: alpha/beta hydrolase [Bacteroidales bacterium]